MKYPPPLRDNEKRMRLEVQVRDIGRTIKGALPAGIGFALLLFDFGEEGSMAYASSAERADMAKALRELLEKMEE